MGFVALLSRERDLRSAMERAAQPAVALAGTPSWPALLRLIRERPVTAALLDLEALAPPRVAPARLLALQEMFPRLPLLLLVRRPQDPVALFRLGRSGSRELLVLAVDDLERELPRALARASSQGATSVVLRAVSPIVPRRELVALRMAMECLHQRWGAEAYAARLGLTRPHLSERLKQAGLPSTGHLLTWARLLHAGLWLEEPGRTGESISRQLEYSSGAAFRRALKAYTGATPTQVAERGGLDFVLGRFMTSCGYGAPRHPAPRVSVA